MQGVDYVSIDPSTQRILTYAYDPEQLRKVTIPIAAIKKCSAMTVTTDYRDACIYILSARVIKQIQNSTMSSIKVHASNLLSLLYAYNSNCATQQQALQLSSSLLVFTEVERVDRSRTEL